VPFAHEEYASQLADLRDQLKIGLSEKPPKGGTPTAVIAERIQSLRESVTVEAAPERTVRKAVRAERPVTARIRERMGERPVHAAPEAVEPPVEVKPEPIQKAEEPRAAPPAAVIAIPEPFKPVNGHAKAVVKRRQGGGEQLRLF
jgi:hypothetical protein